MDVHIEDARGLKEEVIVERRNLEAVVEESRHHRVYLVFEQNQVAHHDLTASGAFGHREPPAEPEGGGCGDSVDGNFYVTPRNVYLQNVRLEISLFAQTF